MMGTRKKTESKQPPPGARAAGRTLRQGSQQPVLPGLEDATSRARADVLTFPVSTLATAPTLPGVPLPGVPLPALAPVPVRQSLASHGRGTMRECFGELRVALAEGWEIVQPIFARPLWSVTDDSATAFNFVLRRERATRLVIVPEGRSVERFIRDRQLVVDYGH